MLRSRFIMLAGILACSGTNCSGTNKDDSSGTDPDPGTGTAADSGSTAAGPGGSSGTGDGTTQAGGTTVEDPTTAGPTAGPTTAGPTAEATSDTADESGTAAPGTAETGSGAVVFLDVFEQVILTNGCTGGYCHGGGAGGLDMTDEATAYANLVEMPATTALCDQTLRVTPGSVDESILWYRVRPAALDAGMPCAPKMPQGSMGLSEAQAQLVNDWIAGGALE